MAQQGTENYQEHDQYYVSTYFMQAPDWHLGFFIAVNIVIRPSTFSLPTESFRHA